MFQTPKEGTKVPARLETPGSGLLIGSGDYSFWDIGYQGEISVGIRGKNFSGVRDTYEYRRVPDIHVPYVFGIRVAGPFGGSVRVYGVYRQASFGQIFNCQPSKWNFFIVCRQI